MVRLLDGASGGGSVKMALDAGFTYVPVNPGWDAVVENLSLVPVVAAGSGRRSASAPPGWSCRTWR